MSRIKLAVVILISVLVLLCIIFVIQYSTGKSNMSKHLVFLNNNKSDLTRYADQFFEQEKTVNLTRYD